MKVWITLNPKEGDGDSFEIIEKDGFAHETFLGETRYKLVVDEFS